MIRIRIPRWLVAAVWFGVVVPAVIAADVVRAAWTFLNGDDERESRWEWLSVALVAVAALGTLGHAQGWWQ